MKQQSDHKVALIKTFNCLPSVYNLSCCLSYYSPLCSACSVDLLSSHSHLSFIHFSLLRIFFSQIYTWLPPSHQSRPFKKVTSSLRPSPTMPSKKGVLPSLLPYSDLFSSKHLSPPEMYSFLVIVRLT